MAINYKLTPAGKTDEQQQADDEAAFQAVMVEEALTQALTVKVHENLESFRKKRKLKKSEMAEMMGVSSRSYYMYETGKRPIPSSALVQLEAFTGADLNEVLLGVAKAPKHDRIKFIVDEAVKALCFLGAKYQDMPMHTKRQVIDEMFRWQRNGERARPDDIIEAVKVVTRYKYHHENLPAPPFWEDYGDDLDAFARDEAAWQKMVDEDLPPNEDNSESENSDK